MKWPAMGCGVGLRSKHYSYIQSELPKMDWFEVVTENFMDTGGRPLAVLESIRKYYSSPTRSHSRIAARSGS